MNRRYFLLGLAAPAALRAVPRAPVKITGITFTPIQGRFHKFVAMNSYDRAPKGHTYDNTLVRIATDQGIEGIGVMSYSGPDAAVQAAVRRLTGANPLELYTMQSGRVTGRAVPFAEVLARYPWLDGPLFDLVGKLTGKPVWKLIGDAVRERVPAYDGTLYFSDIWFRDRGVRAVIEEAEEAVRRGYTGVKLKLGRGSKWMDRDPGLARDIEVVRAARLALGRDIRIMGDPNDGYRDDYDRAWTLLESTRDANLFWIEEIFPENVERYAALRERMSRAGMRTLIADGENFREPQQFEPYLQPRRTLDVVQLDIRTGGILYNLALARMAKAAGAISVPHNWGSQIGFLTALHLAKSVESVPFAEDDRSTCGAIIAEGYEFRAGHYTVPDTPGLGIRVNE